MAHGVWKGIYSEVLGHSKQLLLNRVFDPSTPSMRNMQPPAKNKRAARGLERGPTLSYWMLQTIFAK